MQIETSSRQFENNIEFINFVSNVAKPTVDCGYSTGNSPKRIKCKVHLTFILFIADFEIISIMAVIFQI